MEATVARLKDLVRDVPDFPRPGVVFKDIAPLLADGGAFAECAEFLASAFAGAGVDKVIGVEARGFIIAAPVAVRLGAGFVAVRKAGKLPSDVHTEPYELEYGSDALEVHRDALVPGERVIVVDDVLATGGTAAAAVRLVRRLGAEAAGFGCIIELAFLGGRARLRGVDVASRLVYG